MVDDNIEDLKKLSQEFSDRLDKAVEDGVLDKEENEDLLVKIKQIEMMAQNDKLITDKEREIIKEVNDKLHSSLKGVKKKLD